jgi:hypothetical protein
LITESTPCFRIRRSDGRWFAGHDSRGHAMFKRDESLAAVMDARWAEEQAHLLRCYAHAVELVAADA